MIKSKISRSIVVVIFVALIIFLGYLDVKCIFETSAEPINQKALKVGYVILLISLLILYMYLKEKLYKIKLKRTHALVIRYICLSIVIVIANVIKLKSRISVIGIPLFISIIIINLIASFIIKKVIFNVSKSDMLSVIALLAFCMLPIAIENNTLYFISTIIIMFVFATMLNVQVLVDELKQKGIKTKKYLILSICLGMFMGFSSLFGVNYLVWCILLLVMIGITFNLDNTHINFPKKMMQNITQENREKLYCIERINISKLSVCIITSIILMFFTYYIGVAIFNNIYKSNQNEFVQVIIENIENNRIFNIKDSVFSFGKIKQDSKIFVQFSKNYYLVLFVYIILIEFLSILLKRRYDTKSTVLKLAFILSYIFMCVYGINISILQPLFSIMLVLIALVNTSNLYLNREERVKMLVA